MNNKILDKTVFATIFLLPIVPAYIKIGPINLANIVVAFCIMISMLSLIHLEIRRSITYNSLYWLFVCYMSIRALTDDRFVHFLQYNFTMFIIPVILISYINTKEKFDKSINLLIYGSIPLCIYGLFESVTHINIFQLMESDIWYYSEIRYGLLRIMTTFAQPISYGTYLMFIIALSLYQLRRTDSRKRLYSFTLFIAVINLFLTVSRGPLFSTVFFVFFFLLKFRKEKDVNIARITFILKFIIIGLSALFIFISLNPNSTIINDTLMLVNDVVNGTSNSNESGVGVGDRGDLSTYVYDSLNDNILWGAGFGKEFSYDVYTWHTKDSIENNYLNVMYQTGFIGFILLTLSYVSSLIFSYRGSKKEGLIIKESRISFNYTIFLLLLTYYIEMFFCQETDMMRMYAIIMALLIAYNKNKLYRYE